MAISTSLVDLVQGNYPSSTILETFRDYAETAGINPETIKTIINKSQLSPQELDAAYTHMQTGLAKRIEKGNAVAGLEYLQAMNYIAQSIASTFPAGELTGDPSSDPLVVLKSQLLKAHNHGHKESLEKAIDAFRAYCLKTNQHEFEDGAVTVKLTKNSEYSPGPPGIHAKGYNLHRYGGFVTTSNYLKSIRATDDLRIIESPESLKIK